MGRLKSEQDMLPSHLAKSGSARKCKIDLFL